mmetsp:Transcript_30226/g.22468  ORF Transcript_30226/g.22468 Transcript_30226/m.22468 type:complete len:110 (-) Transcript_30226:108-437(-)
MAALGIFVEEETLDDQINFSVLVNMYCWLDLVIIFTVVIAMFYYGAVMNESFSVDLEQLSNLKCSLQFIDRNRDLIATSYRPLKDRNAETVLKHMEAVNGDEMLGEEEL